MNIAIIPARSGSKGLPDKNIKPLAGKPLIAYTIEAALNSGVFDEVMVSTDSEHYAEIARDFGADVPFLRSEGASSDGASTWEVIREVLGNYRAMGREFEAFCILQPTSPLRNAQDIREAHSLMNKASVAVVSVCEADHPPTWCNILPEDNSLEGFIARTGGGQRQSFGKFYRVNGAIYFVRTGAISSDTYLYRKGSYAYIMPRERSIDIDTELDFRFAEFMLGLKSQGHKE